MKTSHLFVRAAGSAAVALALLAPAAAAQRAVDFERDLLPALERTCFDCHGAAAPEKRRRPKGGLRLDGSAWILKGGSSGDVVVAGQPGASPIYERVVLAPGHDDAMPPKGDPLSDDEVDLLRRWIEQGADFGGWTGVPGPAAKREAQRTPDDGARVPRRIRVLQELARGVEPLPAETIARAAGERAQVEAVLPGSALLRVQFLAREDEVDDEALAALAPLASHVAILDLGRTDVGDAGLQQVAGMSRLAHLDLARTRVGDRGLAHLTGLSELRTLNLYGTAVGDAGLADLARLKKLERLHLWDTQVTKAGVERLRAQRPDLRVHFERELPKPER